MSYIDYYIYDLNLPYIVTVLANGYILFMQACMIAYRYASEQLQTNRGLRAHSLIEYYEL
jgi:hypothetical protein